MDNINDDVRDTKTWPTSELDTHYTDIELPADSSEPGPLDSFSLGFFFLPTRLDFFFFLFFLAPSSDE